MISLESVESFLNRPMWDSSLLSKGEHAWHGTFDRKALGEKGKEPAALLRIQLQTAC
jgi:hypothetical protein